MARIDRGLIAALSSALRERADPAKAPAMQRYMKSEMPFLGVPAPALRSACKEIFTTFPLPSLDVWRDTALALWRDAEYREQRYAAIELTGHRSYREHQQLDVLPMYEEMIVTGAWWDYVDVIASHRLGELLRRHPSAMKRTMRAWARSEDMWKRRSAILCQLGFKQETDLDLLYACIECSIGRKEFFLRKAIGWALRQYAWTDPDEVLRYVDRHADSLDPLSRREALKNVAPPSVRRARKR